MSAHTLPPATSLSGLPPSSLSSILDLLFEHSPTLVAIASGILGSSPSPSSYPVFIDAVGGSLLALSSSATDTPDHEVLVAILGAHPRLGEKKRETLSALSAGEQAQLQEQSGDERQRSEAEAEELVGLNELYEKTFPGLRYVVFVNGRGRQEIFVDMRRRIERGDAKEEEREAITAMCDIAKDRAKKLGRAED